MASAIKLKILEQILQEPEPHLAAAAALAAFREVVAGEYHSALICDLRTPENLHVYQPGDGWLAATHPVLQALQQTRQQNPFFQTVFKHRQSRLLVRSELVPDQVYQRTELYQQTDRQYLSS